MIGDLTYNDELLESFAKVKAHRDNNPGLIILPAHDLRAAEKLAMPATVVAVEG